MKKLLEPIFLAVAVAMPIARPSLPFVSDAVAAEPEEAKVTLHVDGMTCASCSLTVRIALKRLEGVKEAIVSVKEKRALITYDPSKVGPERMVEAVTRAGYKARVARQKGG